MSRRRRSAREKALRSRVARAKCCVVVLVGSGRDGLPPPRQPLRSPWLAWGSSAGAAPTEGAETVEIAAGGAGASLLACGDPGTPRASPPTLPRAGGTLFFTADDGIHGGELWKSDGTRAGTVLVKDIDPDDDGGYDGGPLAPDRVSGGTLFFTVDDGVHGQELWKSDGTRAGTVLVKDISPTTTATTAIRPDSLTGVGGTLFFTADDGIHGPELWKSDGTQAGTVLVKDIDPDDDGDYDDDSGPSYLTGVGGTLFFTADDGIHGRELWKSDGTRAGTVLVKDIHPGDYDSEPLLPDRTCGGRCSSPPGTASTVGSCGSRTAPGRARSWSRTSIQVPDASEPDSLTGVGGRLFFTADDGIHGAELWKSDGTEAGTVLVKDIDLRADETTSEYGALPDRCGGHVVLHRRRRHPRPGAVDVGWHRGGHGPGQGHPPRRLRQRPLLPDRCGGHVVLHRRGRHPRVGAVEVGRHRGGHRPGQGHPSGCRPRLAAHPHLTGMGGTLFFAADDGTRGSELWKSDGTEAGTVLVKDINAGGAFMVASKGQADTSTGTLRLRVAVAGAGRLVGRPAAGRRS